MRYEVSAYITASGANMQCFYFTDEGKAREKQAELLARLPSYYSVDLMKMYSKTRK